MAIDWNKAMGSGEIKKKKSNIDWEKAGAYTDEELNFSSQQKKNTTNSLTKNSNKNAMKPMTPSKAMKAPTQVEAMEWATSRDVYLNNTKATAPSVNLPQMDKSKTNIENTMALIDDNEKKGVSTKKLTKEEQNQKAWEKTAVEYDTLDDDTYALLDTVVDVQTSEDRNASAQKNRLTRAQGELKSLGYTDDEIIKLTRYRQSANNTERAERISGEVKEYAKEHPFLASAASVAMNVASPLGVVELVNAKKTGTPIDPNSSWFAPAQITSDIRGEVQENYDWNIDLNKDGESRDAFDFVYGAGMSTADSLVAGTVMPNIGVTTKSTNFVVKALAKAADNILGGSLIGSQAMVNTVQDVMRRGGTTDEATNAGVVSFLAETLSEAWSIGNFKGLQESGKRGLWNLAKDLIKSSGVNASEEAITETVNLVYDRYALGDKSNFEQNVRAYMQTQKPDGTYFTREEAEKQVWIDAVKQIGEAAAGGAFQGLLMGGTANVTGRVGRYIDDSATGKGIRKEGMTDAVVEAARTSQDELVQEYIQKVNKKGKDKASNADIGSVARELMKGGESTELALETIKSYSRPVALKSEEKVQITHPTLGKKDNKVISLSSVENVKDGTITIKNSEGETQTLDISKLNGKAKDLWTYASEHFTDAKAVESFIQGYNGGDIDTYSRVYKGVFDLASVGMTAERIKKEDMSNLHILGESAFNSAVDAGKTAMSFKQGVVDLTTLRKSRSQKLIMRMADEFGKRHGMNITFVDTLGTREGFYTPNKNQIVIALDSSRGAISRTLGHETYHYVESENAVQAKEISDFVIDTLTKLKGDEWVQKMYADYESKGYDTLEKQKSELVADQMFEVFANERAVKEFAVKDESLFQKVASHIKKLLNEIKNIYKKLVASGNYEDIAAWQEDLYALQKVNDMMLDALSNIEQRKNTGQKAEKNTSEEVGDVLFSVKRFTLTESDVHKNMLLVGSMDNVVDLSGNEFAKGSVGLPDQVDAFFAKYNYSIANPDIGDVEMNRRGAKDSIAHGIGRIKAASFAAVPNTIEKGKIIDYQKNWKGRQYDTIVLAAPISINDERYYQGVIVIRDVSTQRFYLHEVLTEKEGDTSFKTGAGAKHTPGDVSPSLISLLEKVRDVNKNIDDTVYSTKRDAEYMTAVESGDMETAQKMVDEAAKAAGYNSPMLYHGTQSFGFTEFDLSRMDDKRSIFLTSNNKIASTYSGISGTRKVSASYSKDIDGMKLEKVTDELNALSDEYYKGALDYRKYTYIDTKYSNELISTVNDGIDALQKNVSSILNQYKNDGKIYLQLFALNDKLKRYEYQNLSTPIYMLLHHTDVFSENGKEIAELEKNIRLLNEIRFLDISEGYVVREMLDGYSLDLLDETEARDELKYLSSKGNYSMYAKSDNPLVIDGKGQLWRDIRHWASALELKKEDTRVERRDDEYYLVNQKNGDFIEEGSVAVNSFTEEMPKERLHTFMLNKANQMLRIQTEGIYTTREIAKFAKERGYDSVLFKNILDNGGMNSDVEMSEAADIYVYFSPNQIKSADPVTYDNKGKVIPLSQRFDASEDDIRYSVKRVVDDNGSVYENTVVIDTNIFDKKKTRDWGKILQRFVYNNLVGEKVVLTNEDNQEKIIEFAKGNERARKDGAKNAHRVIDKLARKKDKNSQLAVAHSIEIISVMKPTEQKNDHSHQWLDENGWDYYKAILMQRNGKLFEATINVAKTKDGRNILYDINKIKEIGHGVVFSKTESSQRNSHINSDFDDGIITQNKEIVNTKSSTKRNPSISEDASNYILDSKEYQEVLSILDKRMKLVDRKNLSPKAIGYLAGRILRKVKSNYSREQLTERLTALFDYIANSRDVSWEEITEIGAQISKDVLKQSSVLDRSMQTEYADVLKLMKETKVYISPEQKAEIKNLYGSYEAFRKLVGNKIGVTVTDASAVPLDVFWRELSENRPEMFTAETNYLDMPSELVTFIEMTTPNYINPYDGVEMDMDEASYDMALQIYDEYFNIPEVKTEAQKYALKEERLKGKYNAKIKDIHNTYRERIKRIRKEKNNKIEATKELYRQKHEAYRDKRNETDERQKLRRQIIRETKKLTDMLVNPTDKKHIPQELIVGINSFANAMTNHGVFPAQNAARLQQAFKNIGEKAADPDFNIASMYDEEIDAMLDDLTTVMSDKRLGEMTSAELSKVKDIARYFSHIVSMSNRAFSDNIREDLSELQTAALDEVSSQEKEKKRMMTKMQVGLLKPVTFFEIVESPTLEKLYTNIRKGEESWARIVLEAKQERINTQEKYGYKEWADDKVDITTERGDKLSISVKEALSIYATSKRGQGVDHIMKGGIVLEEEARKQLEKKNRFKKNKDKSVNVRSANIPLSLADIQNINMMLTPEQKAYADEIVQYMSSDMAKLGNEVSMKLYGIQKYNEGYYFPLKSANNFLYSEPGVENDSRIKHMSMTKRTVPKANNPVVIGDFTETAMSHCNDMALYYGFALPLEDFKRVWNYKTPNIEGETPSSIKQQLDMVYGDKANKYIKQMLTDVNGGVTKQAGADVVNKFIGLVKKNSVFASLSVAVQQPSALARAFAYVDPKYFTGHHKKGTWEEIKKYAPVAVVKEMGYFDTGIGRQAVDWMTETKYKDLKEKAFALFKDGNYRDDILSMLPSFMDEITWGRIWVAVKNETKAKNPGIDVNSQEFLEACGERFTYVIDHTQVYDSVFSRSEWMRSKDTGVKVATAFMSEPLTNYNLLYSAAIQSKNGNKKLAARATAAYLVSVVFNSILKSFITSLRDDDEEKSYWEKYIANLISGITDEPFGMIPYFNDIVSLVQGYSSERMDTQVLADSVDAISTLFDPEKALGDKVKAVVNTLGLITGLPIKNINRDAVALYNAAMKIINGDFEPTTGRGIGYAIAEKYDSKKFKQYKTPALADQLVEAYAEGDTAHYNKQKKNMLEKYDGDEEQVNTQIKSALKKQYQKGLTTQPQAEKILGDVLGMDTNKIYFTLDEWDSGSEDYSKYDDWYSAVETGKSVAAVASVYKKHGVDKETLSNQITKRFKDEYVSLYKTNPSKAATLKQKLLNAYVAIGYDREKKSKTIDKWLTQK